MAFTKYASYESAEVLDLKGSAQQVQGATLGKLASFDDFRTEDGFLYARIRAISSRVNKNHDGWPSVELAGGPDVYNRIAKQGSFTADADTNHEYGYSTFLGKPIFVDHHNSDPSRARGVIVDAKLHVEDFTTAAHHDSYYESAPENHKPPTWVELLLEVDAKSFPKLAKAIIEGSKNPDKGIDGFSMGCDVQRSVCNICKNSATSPHEYCRHIKMKGAEFDYKDPETGQRTSKKSYEDCYGVGFFEISAVFDPADETALSREVIHEAKVGAPLGYGERPVACPDCNGMGEAGGNVCPTCQGEGFMPAPYGNDGAQTPAEIRPDQLPAAPDFAMGLQPNYGTTTTTSGANVKISINEPQSTLIKAPEDINTLRKEIICEVCGSDVDDTTCEVCGWEKPPEGFDNPDLGKAKEHNLEQQGPTEPADPFGDGFGPDPGEGTSNQPTLAHVKNDMDWNASLPSRVAFTNPDDETPVVPNGEPSSDQPTGETVLEDQTKPVTSNVRTAQDFLAAADANNRRTMSDRTADAASGAPADATADKNVDTEGVGGIMDASNEEASKADAQIAVEGQGGTGVEGVAADKTENVEQGDEKSKNIEEIPTKTFDDGSSKVERQADPVGSGPYPSSGGVTSAWEVTATDDSAFPTEDGGLGGGSANPGTQPADPVGTPDERVNVLDSVTSPANNSGDTETWSGTDGNAVTRQQEPVTTESLEGSDIVNHNSSTHIFAALKTAELEVELGLLSPERKYARASELEQLTPERVSATHEALKRVKTAGLSKGSARTARRLPSMARAASEVKESAEEPKSDPEFLFGS